eukprot:643870-Amorphochlora_amoeboformis.AAC.1
MDIYTKSSRVSSREGEGEGWLERVGRELDSGEPELHRERALVRESERERNKEKEREKERGSEKRE